MNNNSIFKKFNGKFQDRLLPEYFINRSNLFSEIVSRTHDHFWDPNDPIYIDFSQTFPLLEKPIMPFETVPELCSSLANKLTATQQIAFANDSTHWWLSGFLCGEEGALEPAISLCKTLHNPDAVEFATNQAREEARHVTAFTNYIQSRWNEPLPPSTAFQELLNDIVSSEFIHRKIVGMQILVEGLAMGFMASLYGKSNDPVLVRLAQLVMTDEVFHHKAGKLWATYGLPDLTEEEKTDAEDWAYECFQKLMFNVFNPTQKFHLYAKYGFDVEEVRIALRAVYTEDVRRQEIQDNLSVFRLVIKTLLTSGIVTDRTRAMYEKWINLSSIQADQSKSIEDIITSDGLAFLKRVNESRKKQNHQVRT